MNLICTMPVRNEEWCLALTARAALMWCDHLILSLHACTDRSLDIASEIQLESIGSVTVILHPGTEWTEMSQRQDMLNTARSCEATHIAIVDADEILTGSLIPRIRPLIEQHCTPGVMMSLPWLALPRDPMLVITGLSYWGDRQQATVAFRDQPDYNWTARDGYDHHQRPPLSAAPKKFVCPVDRSQGGLMHLQFLSERRLRAKQALYQMNEVLRWPGRTKPEELAKMYGRAVYESDPAARRPGFPSVHAVDVPREWWLQYIPIMDSHMSREVPWFEDDGREPWQEIEVKRLLAEHGRDRFAGLDLFGL